jgi:hypothetical protein
VLEGGQAAHECGGHSHQHQGVDQTRLAAVPVSTVACAAVAQKAAL